VFFIRHVERRVAERLVEHARYYWLLLVEPVPNEVILDGGLGALFINQLITMVTKVSCRAVDIFSLDKLCGCK